MSTYTMFQRLFSIVLFNKEKALVEAFYENIDISRSPTDISTSNPITVGPWNIE